MKTSLFISVFFMAAMYSSSAFCAKYNHYSALNCYATAPANNDCFLAANDYWLTGKKNYCGSTITVLCPISLDDWYSSGSDDIDSVSIYVGNQDKSGTSCVLFSFNQFVTEGDQQRVPDSSSGNYLWSWGSSYDIDTYEVDSGSGLSYPTNFAIKCDLNSNKSIVSYNVIVK